MNKTLETKFARWDAYDGDRLERIRAANEKEANAIAKAKANRWPPGERGTQPHYDAIVKQRGRGK